MLSTYKFVREPRRRKEKILLTIFFFCSGGGGFPAWGIEPNSELVFEIEVLSYN
jgi:hypothetical protein